MPANATKGVTILCTEYRVLAEAKILIAFLLIQLRKLSLTCQYLHGLRMTTHNF